MFTDLERTTTLVMYGIIFGGAALCQLGTLFKPEKMPDAIRSVGWAVITLHRDFSGVVYMLFMFGLAASSLMLIHYGEEAVGVTGTLVFIWDHFSRLYVKSSVAKPHLDYVFTFTPEYKAKQLLEELKRQQEAFIQKQKE